MTCDAAAVTGTVMSRVGELGCHMAGDGGVGDVIGGPAGSDHVGE